MEKSREFFRLALKQINKFSHRPIPEIYTVWFEYIIGENIRLKEEVDSILKSKNYISENNILKIFNKYFSPNITKEAVNILKLIKEKIIKLNEDIEKEHNFHNSTKNNLTNIKKELKNIDKTDIKKVLELFTKEIDTLINREEVFSKIILDSYNDFGSIKEELEQLRIESKKDPLTGLYNRRGFDFAVSKIFKEEEIKEVSLIFIDIDDFKKFNDSFGHLIGDEVLKYIANILSSNLKGKDIIARFGGEEIIILISNTPYENVIQLAEHLREKIANKRLILKNKKEKLPQITVSVGVARLKENEDINSLIERADKLMYLSKKNGKNRVTTELSHVTT